MQVVLQIVLQVVLQIVLQSKTNLSKIANCLGVDILYLFTYPKVFVDKESLPPNNDKISVTFEISPDKREHLLKLITGK